MGRVSAGWVLSQAFFREEAWRTLGLASLEDSLVGPWEGTSSGATPTICWRTCGQWQHADISANDLYGGDFAARPDAITAAPSSCRARPISISPSRTTARSRANATPPNCLRSRPRGATARAIPVLNPEDADFIDRAVFELLAR